MFRFRSLLQISVRAKTNRFRLVNTFSTKSNKVKELEVENPNEPLKFSTSQARWYPAKYSLRGIEGDRLWYEPFVIIGSISVFMIYFCILREENDVDENLGRSLYSRIDGLEELQLRQVLEYNRAHMLDTQDIILRLREIEEERKMNDQKINDN